MRWKAAEENVMFRYSINIIKNENDELNQKAPFFHSTPFRKSSLILFDFF